MIPLVLILFVALAECKGPRHPMVSHHHYHPQPTMEKKLTRDDNLLHDKQHIAEDIGDWSNDPHLTDEEMEFRYFKVHDYDNNKKLDGLEIYQAIKHSMETSDEVRNAEQWPAKENSIIKLIDQVLFEDDTDKDGYLSYAEYVVGRQREKHRRS